MRKIILFIAMRLDGCIADSAGSVSWLDEEDADKENPDTYAEFIKDVDTVITGWITYHQVVTELSPQEWPYSGLQSDVITHNNITSTEEIKYTDEKVLRTSADFSF